jgi:hypothetical protein
MNLIQTLQVACLVFAVILIAVEIQFISAVQKINNLADALDYLIQIADYQQGEIEGMMAQTPGCEIHGDAATQCADPFIREDPSTKGGKPV